MVPGPALGEVQASSALRTTAAILFHRPLVTVRVSVRAPALAVATIELSHEFVVLIAIEARVVKAEVPVPCAEQTLLTMRSLLTLSSRVTLGLVPLPML